MKTKMTFVTPLRTVALMAQVLLGSSVILACSSSNNPATGGTGGAAVMGTGGSAPGTGGTTATSTGGTTATSTGGTTTTSTGGTSGGAAGSTGTSGFGMPACTTTSSGAAVKKAGPCTASDPQMCYNTCGPEKSGVKLETCTGGAYTEMNCQFDPSKDFSCYKIPTTSPAACPTTAITSGTACTVPDCTVCGGTTGYLDSTGAMKTGYCVCQSASTNPTWSCASTTAWPCPSGSGC